MANKWHILFIVIILILLVSCKAGIKGKGRTPPKTEFRTGTEALVLSFIDKGLNRLYEGDNNINLLVEIMNKGAYPLPEDREGLRGHIWISGYDKNLLDLVAEDGTNLDDRELEGKSPINLEGGRSAVIFTGNVFTLPSGSTSYKAPIIVTATYLYKTSSAPIVCIDPNPRASDVKEKVCDIGKYGNIAFSGGQGAPVVVTRVEEEVTSGSILFKIEILNSGKGIVISESNIPRDPNAGYDWRDLNNVEIEEITVGNDLLTYCKPTIGGTVKLINNKGYIVCRFSTGGINEVYTTPLNIRLRYGYSSSVRKDIEIVKDVGFG